MEDKILKILLDDQWILEKLRIVRDLELTDSWIGAGFVRNKVWDHLHGFENRTPLNDVDVIYFDKKKSDPEYDIKFENQLLSIDDSLNWSVKNQARMHLKHGHKPYKNCEESISFWVETPTCIAAQIDKNENLNLIAPHGVSDLLNLRIKPSPGIKLSVFKERINSKKWLEIWPKLKIDIS